MAVRQTVQLRLQAGQGPPFEARFLRFLDEVQANDRGRVQYDLCRNVGVPEHLVILEAWESAADLAAHDGAPHTQALIAELGEYLAGAPVIHRCES